MQKKMFSNSNEHISTFIKKKFVKRKNQAKDYYKLNQYQNLFFLIYI